jgi:choline dehydrogenase-like flavoprotein
MGERFSNVFDCVILGGGISGCIWAHHAVLKNKHTLLVEAGNDFKNAKDYPTGEASANALLYWSGGAELNKTATMGFLRPKVLGGGSVVNQALLDEFDDIVFDEWHEKSGLEFRDRFSVSSAYLEARKHLKQHKFLDSERNKNAQLFVQACDKLGFEWSPLTRAQKDCHPQRDCIDCLSGCKISSKQSLDRVFIDPIRNSEFLQLQSCTQALSFRKIQKGLIEIETQNPQGQTARIQTKMLVLAMGSIGNSLFLLNSGLKSNLPAVGEYFYSHPQFMNLGIFDYEIHSEVGCFQTVKSSDPRFRKKGFKLENVFASPIGLAMLIPGFGREHFSKMKELTRMSCIEVAIRDTHPGSIKKLSKTRASIDKTLDKDDAQKQKDGLSTINQIFQSAGAREIITGRFGIGLHLMGGCRVGTHSRDSVFNADFALWDYPEIHCSDSSIFPSAPGINPSLTIMALSHQVAKEALDFHV